MEHSEQKGREGKKNSEVGEQLGRKGIKRELEHGAQNEREGEKRSIVS